MVFLLMCPYLYSLFHRFFILIFCVLDVIGEVVNVGPLEDLMEKWKSSTKLELTSRDISFIQLIILYYIIFIIL